MARDNRWKLTLVANSGLFTAINFRLLINEHCPYQINTQINTYIARDDCRGGGGKESSAGCRRSAHLFFSGELSVVKEVVVVF